VGTVGIGEPGGVVVVTVCVVGCVATVVDPGRAVFPDGRLLLVVMELVGPAFVVATVGSAPDDT
jgi:hypothetical protein